METVEEYKQRLQIASAHGATRDEQAIVEELLTYLPNESDALLEWIFVEHRGDVTARVKAGLKLLERNPERIKQAVERLLDSNDPNDRSTVLQVLEDSPNRVSHNIQASVVNQRQQPSHKVSPIIGNVAIVAISLFILGLPPLIWVFVTQRFTIQMFVQSIIYLVQFSSMIIAGLLPFHISSESQANGTVYLLNLIPLVLLGVPTFLINWRQFGVKKAIYATSITIVVIVFLMELAALVVMELFSHVGP